MFPNRFCDTLRKNVRFLVIYWTVHSISFYMRTEVYIPRLSSLKLAFYIIGLLTSCKDRFGLQYVSFFYMLTNHAKVKRFAHSIKIASTGFLAHPTAVLLKWRLYVRQTLSKTLTLRMAFLKLTLPSCMSRRFTADTLERTVCWHPCDFQGGMDTKRGPTKTEFVLE